MIISHKHSFIFIKLRKTAGTSLEIALSGICGNDDVITPISAEDEAVRQELGYRGPQNVFVPKCHYSMNDWINLLSGGERKLFYNHMPAREIRNCVSGKVWKRYFKFCFERNPWDKTISHYYHRSRAQQFENVMDYLHNNRKDAIRGYDMYSDRGKVIVDRIFRYEEMDRSLEELSRLFGTTVSLPEYRAKSQFRTDNKHYRDILSTGEAELIGKRFSREIDLLGYTF